MLALLLGSTSFAQDVAHLTYDVSVSSDNPQVEAMKSMMDGSKMDIYSNGKFIRSDFNLGTLSTNTSIVDLTNKNLLILISSGMSGQKMALQPTLAEMDSAKMKEGEPKVVLTGDVKKIGDYTCKKATLTRPDGVSFDVWYTDQIKIGDLSGTMADFKGVPGVPLEYTVYQGPMKILFTFVKYEPNATVAQDFFSMDVPAGYKVMSKEDLENMSH